MVAGCTGDQAPASPDPDRVLPELTTDFGAARPTWAQGRTVHYGSEQLRVERGVLDGAISELHPTPYGFVVRGEESWALVGRGGTHPLPAELSSIAVSRDGHLLGWIDRHGPMRPAGRVAEAVVVDLATGEITGRTSEGMGGGAGDDLGVLYSELPPVFLGFDDPDAYYQGAGDTHRWDPRTGETSALPRPEDLSRPVWRRGQEYGAAGGVVTADGDYRIDMRTTAEIEIWRRGGGERRRATPDFGHRWAFLGHPLNEDRVLFLTLDRFHWSYDPTATDRTHGFLTLCRLDAERCRDLRQVTGTRSVVFPAGPGPRWGDY